MLSRLKDMNEGPAHSLSLCQRKGPAHSKYRDKSAAGSPLIFWDPGNPYVTRTIPVNKNGCVEKLTCLNRTAIKINNKATGNMFASIVQALNKFNSSMTCRKVQGESQDSAVSESVERSRPGNHILISGPRPTLTLIFALFYFTDFCLIAAPRRQRKSFAITHRKYYPCLILSTILKNF